MKLYFLGEKKQGDYMIYDAHIHFDGERNLNDSVKYFTEFFKKYGVQKANVLSYFHEGDTVDFLTSDFKCIWLKKAMSPNMFAFMSVCHKFDERDTKEVYLNQLNNGIEMGFDGLKMLDGKPDSRKRLGKSLAHENFDLMYEKCENTGFPILYHVADPEKFWSMPLEYRWSYADGTFPTKEQAYLEIDELLKKFPNLNVTFAHFYFMSGDMDRVARFFEDHKNVKFDITPGREMFADFSKDVTAWRDFFNTYKDRIIFGSDLNNSLDNAYHTAIYELLLKGLTDGDPFHVIDIDVKPLGLPKETLECIMYKNFVKLCGENPKPINEDAVRKYLSAFLAQNNPLTNKEQTEILQIAKDFGL